jgi:hypothetical protein
VQAKNKTAEGDTLANRAGDRWIQLGTISACHASYMSNKPIFLIYSDDLTDDLSDDLTASSTRPHSTFPQGMKNMDALPVYS